MIGSMIYQATETDHNSIFNAFQMERLGVGGRRWCNVGEPHHAGTTVSGATTEEHVLRGKYSSYKHRTVRPLQSAALYLRCMSASATFEYSSYYLGNLFANAFFNRDRCSRNLPFNALYRMTKAFRTLQCYVIPIRLCAPYNPCKFAELVANHPL
ncbi:hypothetical protein AVEN_136335-1 [Araneus ventricosus]|uniref:Uncharacterized protein n=1 Tax=Araneus ventricosus TaxID=182803 RepID=A0A4Y2E3N6_ARAVE|nr:hypothetical protein AVEN_136335-1 [Araneus ventricosus]